MGLIFARPTVNKILVSTLTGVGVFLLTWLYLNSYYTLEIEDDLFNREVIIKRYLLHIRPKQNKQFVFISTGKDLSLVNDNTGYGNIVVSDRYKLLKFLQAINTAPVKPRFVLLDLQFYFPYNNTLDDSLRKTIPPGGLQNYFPDIGIDTAIQSEIKKMKRLAISVLVNDNKVDTPIYKAKYGIADFKTYSGQFNKFRLNYAGLNTLSIPALMHREMDGAKYSGPEYATFCNGRLCFNYIWPGYYYDDQNIKKDSTFQVYHIGMLTGLPNYAQIIGSIVPGKVVCIGNFEGDMQDTPGGKISGTLVLANLYLSLLNGDHYAPYLWVLMMVAVFSLLSYMAIYNKLPDIRFNSNFAIARHASSFLNKYVSFITALVLLSLVSVFVFNVMISLFLPAFIFSVIDFFIKKKYKPKQI